jgi:hypothetical protein
LKPGILCENEVEDIRGLLRVDIVFAPKLYLERARQLLTKTRTTKIARSFVTAEISYAKKFLRKQPPTAVKLTFHVAADSNIVFSPDVIPKIMNTNPIKSTLEFILKKLVHKSLLGNICPDFQYDASESRFVGGILQQSLPVPKLISKKLGEPKIGGIELDFKGSPIGLEKVEVSTKEGKLNLSLLISRRVNNFRDIYPKVLSETEEIAQMLLRKVP